MISCLFAITPKRSFFRCLMMGYHACHCSIQTEASASAVVIEAWNSKFSYAVLTVAKSVLLNKRLAESMPIGLFRRYLYAGNLRPDFTHFLIDTKHNIAC